MYYHLKLAGMTEKLLWQLAITDLTDQGGKSMGFDRGDSKGGYGDRRPMTFHKATCSECKKECEVPFKPSGERPVYCKDCFSKRKNNER